MRRALLLLLTIGLLLAGAPAAFAKFSSASVCGPSACRRVTFDEGHGGGHALVTIEEAAIGGTVTNAVGASHSVSRPGPSHPPAAPSYRVTLCPERCGSPLAVKLRVAPATGLEFLGGKRGWAIMDRRARIAYHAITRGLRPFGPRSLVAFGASERKPAPRLAQSAGGLSAVGLALGTAGAALALGSLYRWRASR